MVVKWIARLSPRKKFAIVFSIAGDICKRLLTFHVMKNWSRSRYFIFPSCASFPSPISLFLKNFDFLFFSRRISNANLATYNYKIYQSGFAIIYNIIYYNIRANVFGMSRHKSIARSFVVSILVDWQSTQNFLLNCLFCLRFTKLTLCNSWIIVNFCKCNIKAKNIRIESNKYDSFFPIIICLFSKYFNWNAKYRYCDYFLYILIFFLSIYV